VHNDKRRDHRKKSESEVRTNKKSSLTDVRSNIFLVVAVRIYFDPFCIRIHRISS
jgi:hypothetical protein